MVALHTTMKLDVQKMDKSTESLQSDIVIKRHTIKRLHFCLECMRKFVTPKKFLSEFINTNYWITTTGLTCILEKIDTVQQSNAKSIAIYQTK